MRARRFLLQPTARQRASLERLLEAQRELYNAALEERRGAWRWERRSVGRYEQFKELTGFDHPVLDFGVVPARGTLARLDRAFAAFYRRCRSGQSPGFPRFKARHRFHSVDYGDRGCWAYRPDARRIHLMGVGEVKFVAHKRAMTGRPKTCVRRRARHQPPPPAPGNRGAGRRPAAGGGPQAWLPPPPQGRCPGGSHPAQAGQPAPRPQPPPQQGAGVPL